MPEDWCKILWQIVEDGESLHLWEEMDFRYGVPEGYVDMCRGS